MSQLSPEDELLAPEPGETSENPMTIDDEIPEDFSLPRDLDHQPKVELQTDLEQQNLQERISLLPRIPKIATTQANDSSQPAAGPSGLQAMAEQQRQAGTQNQPTAGATQISLPTGPSTPPSGVAINYNEKKLRLRELVYSLFPTYHEAVVCMADTGRFIPCEAYNQGNICPLESGHTSQRVKGKREGHICEVCHFAADLNNPHTAGNCKLEEFLMRKSHEMAHAHAMSSLRATWQSPHAPERGRGRGRGRGRSPRGSFRGKAPKHLGKNRKNPTM